MNSSKIFILFPSWGLQTLGLVIVASAVLVILIQTIRPKFIRLHGWASLFQTLKSIPFSLIQIIYQAFALVLVMLPCWWASVFCAYIVNKLWAMVAVPNEILLSPTAIFCAGLIVFYLTFLYRGFTKGHNPKFRDQRSSDATPPTQPKKVAVIGAGMAGMVATKALQEEGHEVIVYERTESWGGVWASSKKRGGRAWGTTMTSTGALNTTFSDCPVPVHNEENGKTPLHFSRQQFADLMQTYNERYNVFNSNLIANAEVTKMERIDGDRWRLEVDCGDGNTTIDEFDAVTICTGLNHEPWTPDFEGVGSFTGEEIHINDYDAANPQKYKDKKVLMVGVGETAADLAVQLADNGVDHIYAVPRNSTLTLARNSLSIPPDYPESRLVYAGPMFNRWALLILSLPQMLTDLIGPSRVPSGSAGHFLGLLRPHQTIKQFPSILASVNTTKADGLWQVLDSGKASLAAGIKEITSTGAKLDDGSELEVDVIIYCTGYRTKNSFLPPLDSESGLVQPVISSRDFYKLTIHPELPNVAAIGFARGLVGAITLSSEMQSRWWALILSGKRMLPSTDAMKADVKYLSRKSRFFRQPTRTTMTFANSVARHEVGCEPDLFMLFKSDRKLWWQVLNGAICNAHFRIHGVGAKPELAREQLLMPYSLHDPEYRDYIDMFYNIIPLQILLIPIWTELEKRLPSFFTRSALGSYV